MNLNKDEMRDRYWELTDKMQAVRVESAPLHEESRMRREDFDIAQSKLKKVNAEIAEIEHPVLNIIGEELAIIARALGKKLGPRPTIETE